MRRFLEYPIGPALIIPVVPYSFWLYYSGTFSLWQAHRAAAISVAVVLCITLLLRVITGSSVRAGAIAALIVAAVVFLGKGASSSIVILLVVVAVLLLNRFRPDVNAMAVLNVFGAAILASTLYPIAGIVLERRAAVPTENKAFGDINLTAKPSIIHIVLDGYGAPNILSEYYGHDTGPFIDALKARGFVVMEKVITPYSQTLPTMASIMSGDTVDLISAGLEKNRLRRDLGYTVSNGPAVEALRNAGYTIAWTESGYHFLDFNGEPEIMPPSGWMTSFEANLLQDAFGRYGIRGLNGRTHSARLRAQLTPGTLAGLPQPFFYYQHLIAPHPPFSINADGTDRHYDSVSFVDAARLVGLHGERRAPYIEGYREKAIFVEKALMSQIDAFPEGPKVVIIHGDHGPGAFLVHARADLSCMAERMQTFAAIYTNVPELKELLDAQQHRRFFLSNLYRVIFSGLSDREFQLLPGRSRHLNWDDLTAQYTVTPEDLEKPCGRTTAGSDTEYSLMR